MEIKISLHRILPILLMLSTGPFSSQALAGNIDFNNVISESQNSEKELAHQLDQIQPPSRVGKDGLINKHQKMKRERLDGDEESIASHETKDFFQSKKQKITDEVSKHDEKKDLKRLSTEIDQSH